MPVVELHHGVVLEEVLPLGLKGHDVGRDPAVGELRPRIVDHAGVQPRHERTWRRANEAHVATGPIDWLVVLHPCNI